MQNEQDPIDVDAWIASLAHKFNDRPDGGHVERACCAQRFFVRTAAEAREAETRALLAPELVLELARADLESADVIEWDRAAWWRRDIAAERDARDATARREVATRYAMEHATDAHAVMGAVGLVLHDGFLLDTSRRSTCCELHPLRSPGSDVEYCPRCNVDALRAELARLQPERVAEMATMPARCGDELTH